MADLETIARQAGEAVRREARARRLQGRDVVPRRWGRLPVVATPIVLVAVVITFAVRGGGTTAPQILDQPPGPSAPIAEDGVLPVPAVGEVIAAYLDDLAPVFVSHPVDGEVLVLDAVDPRNHRLVVFCGDAGWFVDVLHHSTWSRWGDYTGGPGPTGLPDYPTTLVDGGEAVQVTGPVRPGPERTDRRGPPSPQDAPWCSYGEPGTAFGPDTVAHQAPTSPPPLAGTQVPDDRWVWAAVTYGGTDADPRVCDPDGSCPDEAPRLTTPFRTDEQRNDDPIGPNSQVRLVRATPDGIVALAAGQDGFPTEPTPTPDRTEVTDEVDGSTPPTDGGTPGEPVLDLGAGSLWSSGPVEGVEDAAHRFAREVLGWDAPVVDAFGDIEVRGPTTVRLRNPELTTAPIEAFFSPDPDSERGWLLDAASARRHHLGVGGINLAEPGEPDRLGMDVEPAWAHATRVTVLTRLIGDTHQTSHDRAEIDRIGAIPLAGRFRDLEAYLILHHDDQDRIIGASGNGRAGLSVPSDAR